MSTAQETNQHADRAKAYRQNQSEFRGLRGLVTMPKFNPKKSTEDAEILKRHDDLSKWLKKEAKALWFLGVDVYDIQGTPLK